MYKLTSHLPLFLLQFQILRLLRAPQLLRLRRCVTPKRCSRRKSSGVECSCSKSCSFAPSPEQWKPRLHCSARVRLPPSLELHQLGHFERQLAVVGGRANCRRLGGGSLTRFLLTAFLCAGSFVCHPCTDLVGTGARWARAMSSCALVHVSLHSCSLDCARGLAQCSICASNRPQRERTLG